MTIEMVTLGSDDSEDTRVALEKIAKELTEKAEPYQKPDICVCGRPGTAAGVTDDGKRMWNCARCQRTWAEWAEGAEGATE